MSGEEPVGLLGRERSLGDVEQVGCLGVVES